jgi:hypothetical protein
MDLLLAVVAAAAADDDNDDDDDDDDEEEEEEAEEDEDELQRLRRFELSANDAFRCTGSAEGMPAKRLVLRCVFFLFVFGRFGCVR